MTYRKCYNEIVQFKNRFLYYYLSYIMDKKNLSFVSFFKEQLSQNLGINIKRSSTGCKLPNMMTKAQTTVPKIKQSELRTGDFSGISEGQSQAEKVWQDSTLLMYKKILLE